MGLPAFVPYTIQKQLGKPSFLGRDKSLETFWGYQLQEYFRFGLVLKQDIFLRLAYLNGGKVS